MIPKRAGGPGDFAGRLQRLLSIDGTGVSIDAFSFQEAVLRWQSSRSGQVPSPQPLAEVLLGEVRVAIEQLATVAPEPLQLAASAIDEALMEKWLEHGEVDSGVSIWFRIGSAPILEGRARTAPEKVHEEKSRCPVCGGLPQVSAIVEESGEFMQGSPRYLICSRCAFWWRFARATCPTCGEHNPSELASFRADAWPWARIDSCQTCHTYIKTFDLREPGANSVVPLVDDLTTLSLDLWALQQGLERQVPSLAGV